MLKEFKKFALRGNMIDLAVGIIIGGAFNGIVSSLVNDMIMPVFSLFSGRLDFSNWFIALDGKKYQTLLLAQEAGAATVNFGKFISVVLNFIIIAFTVFLIVKFMNRLRKEAPAPVDKPAARLCPECLSEIHADAKRCPYCTSILQEDDSKEARE